ncbi:MAG: 4-hydroxy-tetrahydrodipicolinate synthase [Thiotrichaceae bacterium]
MFGGSMVALITPMLDHGEVDEAALEKLIAFHIESGTDAIIAMGTTGESATFSHSEHTSVVKRIVEIVAGELPVIAGTGSNSTQEALALTEKAMQDGADAALLVTPYYNKPTQEGLYQHYKHIAENVALPQILYNVPGRTAVDLLPETVERLASISNIVGIKEATGDLSRAERLIDSCAGQLDIYSGDDGTAMELMLMGGQGDISVTANVAPAAMHVMCEAAIMGDRQRAEEINAHLEGLHVNLFLEANPIPVKWAMHKMGYGQNVNRLPLTAFSEEYHADLMDAMHEAGVNIE